MTMSHGMVGPTSERIRKKKSMKARGCVAVGEWGHTWKDTKHYLLHHKQ